MRHYLYMGRPVFEPEACGIKGETEPYLKRTIEIEDADSAFYDGRDKNKARFEVSSIFMGTIHTVLWTDDLDKLNKEKTGSAISNHFLNYLPKFQQYIYQ